MKKMSAFALVSCFALSLFITSQACAGDDWQKVGELAKDGAGRISVNKTISYCKIVGMAEVSVVNTLIIFKGGDNKSYPLTAKLKKGEAREVSVGDKINVTDISASVDRGAVELYVK